MLLVYLDRSSAGVFLKDIKWTPQIFKANEVELVMDQSVNVPAAIETGSAASQSISPMYDESMPDRVPLSANNASCLRDVAVALKEKCQRTKSVKSFHSR